MGRQNSYMLMKHIRDKKIDILDQKFMTSQKKNTISSFNKAS